MKPILFKTDMVRAILDGRKKVTRRVVKPKYKKGEAGFRVCWRTADPSVKWIEKTDEDEHGFDPARYVNPPYKPGDILYAREAVRLFDFDYINGDWSAATQYRADNKMGPRLHYLKNGANTRFGWRPSIHMPREAARIFLRVTDVRVERLKDMSATSALDEGFTDWNEAMRVWDSTIKPADLAVYGWAANPWVWVISFERIEKPEATT